ncbi:MULTISPECIES: hypothetical protein [unclassified Microbacterium]|uniref:hypothetical protein n=1 Tax=unclassified Microbacterium TaxID=2609290 RepID=UPI003018AC5E
MNAPERNVATALTTDPLSEYIRPDMSDSDELMHEQEEMIQQCIQADGFEYTVVEVEPTAIPGGGFEFGFVPERAWTEEHGYGTVDSKFFPPDYVSDLDSDPNCQYTQGVAAAQQKAYDTALYGKDWAKCFLDAGYPKDARAAFEARVQKYREDHPDATTEDAAVPTFRSEELAMALADSDCKDKVDYTQRTLRAMADLEKDYIADHKGELEEAKLWLAQ